VQLHGFLHVAADDRGRLRPLALAQVVEASDRALGAALLDFRHKVSWLVLLSDEFGCGPAEYNQVEEGVGAQAVGSVDARGGDFPAGPEARDDIGTHAGDLALVIRGHPAHVVVDGRQHWAGIHSGVHACKCAHCLQNAGQALVEQLLGQMVQVQMYMVTVLANAAALHDFDCHGSRHNISGCQVLGSGSVPLHEAFAFRIPEDSAFSAAAFSQEAAYPLNSSRVELHELEILVPEISACDGGISVSGAGVSAGAGLLRATLAAGGEHGVFGSEAVEGAVGHIHGEHADALAVLHDEVEQEVLHEEVAVLAECAAEQGVQHRVTSAVGHCAGSLGLAALAELE